jgi:hypothetical protein
VDADAVEVVEEVDRVLAAVFGEVPAVRSIIVRLAPMKRERSKVEMPARSAKVAKVCLRSIDAPDRVDPEGSLCGFSVAAAEVAKVEVPAAWGGEDEAEPVRLGSAPSASSAIACSGTAR